MYRPIRKISFSRVDGRRHSVTFGASQTPRPRAHRLQGNGRLSSCVNTLTLSMFFARSNSDLSQRWPNRNRLDMSTSVK